MDYKAGIYLNSVEDCSIINNRFGYYYSNQNDYGIFIYNSNNNLLKDNICSYNNYIGIYSENSNDNKIINNNCNKNLNYGMFITSNNNNNFVNNICNENDNGIHLLQSNFCRIIGNVTNNNDYNGINIRYYSNNNFLYNNTSTENGDTGFKISFISKNNILHNNISEINTNGLQITESSDKNILINNTFFNNYDDGIVIDNSDNNVLIKNLSDSNTTFGLNIISSDNNNIYMNTFSNNSFPVNSNSSINNWNSPTEISYEFNDYSYHKKFLGNFYGNYSGSDSDGDGIGDSYYNLPGSEPNDNYPLILSSDKYILQAWWLSADSIMYKDSLGNPLHEVTIPGTQSNMWISDQPINSNLNFSTNDTWTGQILFATPLQIGITFSFEVGYSTTGENFVFCGPDTTIVGDGSTMQFTYKTDGSNYFMPAGSYYALKIYNNAGSNYNVVTGGGSTYISGPVYSPELFLNPSDSLNFGKVDKTNINDSTLTILAKNIGKTELIIDSLLSLEPPFSVNFPTPDTIQVGDSIFIPITLEREFDVGMYIDTLYIFDNCNNSSIIITAQLTEPTVSVIPDTINFGIQAISDEKDSLSFVIKNLGSSKLIIDGFSGLTFPFNISYELPDTVYPEIGDSSEIFISFDRSTPGYFIDTLWIYNNDIDTSIVVIGELAQPIISIDPNYIDFGTTSATNQSDSLSFKIKNCGTGNLIIDGLNGLSLPFNISCSIPDTILPSDSSEIYIILDMSIAGSYIDTLLISNNDKDTSLVITAELTAPIIYLNPDFINFGSMPRADEYDSLSFVIKNIGTEDLIIDNFGGLSSPFNVNYSLPDTILPSDSSEIFIILDMSIAGSYIDTLLISNNDKDTSLVITAELTAPIIYLNPDFINFGSMPRADEYDSLSFVIKNIGTEDLTVNSIAGLSPPFGIDYPTPDTIQIQDSSLVFIILDKSMAGSYCDTLLIYNNDQDTSLIVTAEITAPIISLTPEDTLHFGVMDTTSILDSTKVIWVKNIGTADLIINNLWGLSSPFSFSYNYPDTLIPGDSTEIPVILERNFLPGLYCDTLMVDNNDINTSIVVTAELTEPIITLYPDIIDFGTKSVSDQFDSLSFVIKNIGTGDLVIDGLTGLAAPFSINYSIPDTIQPSDSSEIFIILDMSIAGSYIDTLLIYNNDKDTSLVVTAELTTPIIYLNPDSIDFGVIEKSVGYDSLSFIVTNLGDGNLIIDGFDGLSEPFSVNHILPDTINPVSNDSSKIYVKLNKNISGLFCDTLYIFNNDNDTSLIVTAEITEPLIAIIPDTIDFGILEMCSEIDSLPFIIKNPGNGDLIVNNVAGLSPPFSINYSTPDTICPISDSSQIFVKIDKNIAGLYCDTLLIYNNAKDTTLVIIAHITEPPDPIINYITDVPYDQGREVVINWFKSPLDDPAYKVITGYSIWRKQDWAKDPWEYIGFTIAHYFDEYAFIAPTISDSTEGNIPYYTFIVSAETTDPFLFYDSEPDSGYSVDNIAPNSVKNIGLSFNGGDDLQMQWSEVLYGTYNGNLYPELNGIWYKIYGSEDFDFECNASTLITTTQDITYIYNIIDKEKMFFKVITSDQP